MISISYTLCRGVVTNGGKWAPAQPGAVLGDFIAVSRNEETEEAGKIGPHFHFRFSCRLSGVSPLLWCSLFFAFTKGKEQGSPSVVGKVCHSIMKPVGKLSSLTSTFRQTNFR